MRDASITIWDNVIISKMATTVRDRETLLLDAIFRHSTIIDTEVVHPVEYYSMDGIGSIEGGDVLIARDDIICAVAVQGHHAKVPMPWWNILEAKAAKTPHIARTAP